MKVIYNQENFLCCSKRPHIYELKSDLECVYLHTLLNDCKENDEIELSMYENVFSDLLNDTLNFSKYDPDYLYNALEYFGSSKREQFLDFIVEKINEKTNKYLEKGIKLQKQKTLNSDKINESIFNKEHNKTIKYLKKQEAIQEEIVRNTEKFLFHRTPSFKSEQLNKFTTDRLNKIK